MIAGVFLATGGFVLGAVLAHTYHARRAAPPVAALPCEPSRVEHPELTAAAAASMFEVSRSLQQELARARRDVRHERGKTQSLSAEARTDSLTGLPNRRAFDEHLAWWLDQWRRGRQTPVSLLLIDVDRFKQLNDRYGHPAGDAALRWLAKKARATVREVDVAARYGGEEFAVIMPGVAAAAAAVLAERLRAAIAAEPFTHAGATLQVTASIGLATSLGNDDPASLARRADEALYAAKQNGRNRCYRHDGRETIAVPPEVPPPQTAAGRYVAAR